MQTKTFDGIKKIKIASPVKRVASNKSLKVDGLVKTKIKKPHAKIVQKNVGHFFVVPDKVYNHAPAKTVTAWQKIKRYPKVPAMVLALALLVAFTGGMWAALNTTKTEAVDQTELDAPAGSLVLATSTAPVSNDLLFNTPLQDLKNYFESTAQPSIIQKRTGQLEQFLADWKSPLEPDAETIAQQPHWKLILAIAFAESTLGKHCYEYNCSGIGGSDIKTYSSSRQWIIDFNRLLEKRYKDQTLEQMCGVYVQPCNPNWLTATKQILSSLQEKGIE